MSMTRAEAAAIARAKRAENIPPLAERFWSKVDIKGEDECWPWRAAVRRKEEGYGAFWMNGRHHPSNRVAIQLSGIDVPDGMVTCHKCDNPRCCNPKHLFVGTPRDNNDDKVTKGRHCKGESVWTSKLSSTQVQEIRSMKLALGGKRFPKGVTEQIANQYGVTKAYVSEVLSRGWGK